GVGGGGEEGGGRGEGGGGGDVDGGAGGGGGVDPADPTGGADREAGASGGPDRGAHGRRADDARGDRGEEIPPGDLRDRVPGPDPIELGSFESDADRAVEDRRPRRQRSRLHAPSLPPVDPLHPAPHPH